MGRDATVVASAAEAASRMLFTLDKGFGDIRSNPPGTHPAIVVLRSGDQSAGAVRRALTPFLDRYELDDIAGAIVIVEHGLVRVRRAPT